MRSTILFRLLAIAITGVLMQMRSDRELWQSVVLSMGFGHYFLSLVYAKGRITTLMQSPAAVPLVLLVLLGPGMYFAGLPIVLYFAVHHVFNENYLVKRDLPYSNDSNKKFFAISSALLNFAAYYCLARSYSPLARVVVGEVWLAIFGVTLLLFIAALLREPRSWSVRSLLETCNVEILGILLVGVSLYYEIGFLPVVCYHFVLWALHPLPKLAARGQAAMYRYIFLTVLFTCAALLLSPIGIWQYPLLHSVFWNQFMLWSFIHITTSFAFSRAQPEWISRWFNPTLAQNPAQ